MTTGEMIEHWDVPKTVKLTQSQHTDKTINKTFLKKKKKLNVVTSK